MNQIAKTSKLFIYIRYKKGDYEITIPADDPPRVQSRIVGEEATKRASCVALIRKHVTKVRAISCDIAYVSETL